MPFTNRFFLEVFSLHFFQALCNFFSNVCLFLIFLYIFLVLYLSLSIVYIFLLYYLFLLSTAYNLFQQLVQLVWNTHNFQCECSILFSTQPLRLGLAHFGWSLPQAPAQRHLQAISSHQRSCI